MSFDFIFLLHYHRPRSETHHSPENPKAIFCCLFVDGTGTNPKIIPVFKNSFAQIRRCYNGHVTRFTKAKTKNRERESTTGKKPENRRVGKPENRQLLCPRGRGSSELICRVIGSAVAFFCRRTNVRVFFRAVAVVTPEIRWIVIWSNYKSWKKELEGKRIRIESFRFRWKSIASGVTAEFVFALWRWKCFRLCTCSWLLKWPRFIFARFYIYFFKFIKCGVMCIVFFVWNFEKESERVRYFQFAWSLCWVFLELNYSWPYLKYTSYINFYNYVFNCIH